jgi:hypothetical protein
VLTEQLLYLALIILLMFLFIRVRPVIHVNGFTFISNSPIYGL